MMHRIRRSPSKALLAAVPLFVAPLFAGCSSEGDPDTTGGAGGTPSSGGRATGGSPPSTGGVSATGGAAGKSATGGMGGTTGGAGGAGGTTGGGSGAGGTPTGGMSSLGGSGAGGAAGSGGMGGLASPGGNSGSAGQNAGGAGGRGGMTGAGGAAAGAAGSAGMTGSGGSGSTGMSAGCGKTRTLMNGRKTISSGGNREYILRVPDSYDNMKPYRLIIAYHWLNGNAQQVADGAGSTEDPYYGLWDLAENSTIFVAPEGLNAGWANSGGADVTLTDAILKQVEDDLCIDTTRIFATGFSYGAGMSYAIACARATVFRGVILYAGGQLSGCSGGTTPIAYMHVHGVNDSVLPVSGGRTMRDHYVGVNGCTAMNPTDPAGNSGMHKCTSYEGCSAGHPVRWCAHGGDHNPTEKDSGQSKSWVPGEAWTFIKQF